MDKDEKYYLTQGYGESGYSIYSDLEETHNEEPSLKEDDKAYMLSKIKREKEKAVRLQNEEHGEH